MLSGFGMTYRARYSFNLQPVAGTTPSIFKICPAEYTLALVRPVRLANNRSTPSHALLADMEVAVQK